MNKFLLIFLCLGVFPTIGLAQSKEDFYKSVDRSKRQTERYTEDKLGAGEWYVGVCESLVGLAGKYHLNRPWCKLFGDLHQFDKDSCKIFMDTGIYYTKYAECLLKMAQNLESKVEEKRESVVREYCSAEAGKSIYKEYDDLKGYYRSLGEPEIICADSREDDRCLLVQSVESNAGAKGVYYTCNRPKLEFSETGVITVKRDVSTCGLCFLRYYPTGVLSKDGTEYSLDDFDTKCVLKSWENIKN